MVHAIFMTFGDDACEYQASLRVPTLHELDTYSRASS